MRRRIIRLVIICVILFLLFLVFSIVLPPLFHKKTDAVPDAVKPSGQKENVRCIDQNEDALIWRLRLIEGAKEKLVLSTFAFGDDNSGKDMMAALLHAADRGVSVHILVDGISGALDLNGSKYFRALAAHPNVEAKFYNPINLLTPWKLNYRMHDKYLIMDDVGYILGGRNTNDLFLGSYRDSYNVDRDIFVYSEGPGASLTQLQAYFGQVWNLSCSKRFSPGVSRKTEEIQEEMAGRYQEIREKYPEIGEETDWKQETIEADSVTLLANPIEPENKKPELFGRLCQRMEAGKDVMVETPYIVCNDAMYEKMRSLCEDGIKLQMTINAVEGGANPFGCTDYLNHKDKILETGAEVFEAICGQSLHRKTILIDDTTSIVGSFNWDMRSVYLDTELMLVIECPKLNEELRAASADMMAHSRHVMPDGTESLGEAFQPVELGFGKKCFYGILRVLILPFRHLL